jgi:hypothetical protein
MSLSKWFQADLINRRFCRRPEKSSIFRMRHLVASVVIVLWAFASPALAQTPEQEIAAASIKFMENLGYEYFPGLDITSHATRYSPGQAQLASLPPGKTAGVVLKKDYDDACKIDATFTMRYPDLKRPPEPAKQGSGFLYAEFDRPAITAVTYRVTTSADICAFRIMLFALRNGGAKGGCRPTLNEAFSDRSRCQ